MSDVIKLGALNGNAPEPVKVDLFDKAFTLRRVTRSVQLGLEKVQAELDRLGRDGEVTGDNLVATFGEGLDVLLKPDQHRTPAKKIIVAQWESDELDLDQITAFFYKLQEDAAANRPS